MDLLASFKNKTGAGRKESYTLTQIVGIIAMLNEGLTPVQVAELTGKSVNSIRYKFCEGEVELNGKKTIRSVKRYGSMQELYADHGETFSDQDLANRINQFKSELKAQVDSEEVIENNSDESAA